MSYCRMSRESDVYMYADVDGYICCCGCFMKEGGIFRFRTRKGALSHLLLHRAKDDTVPQYAIDRLEKEIKEVGNYTNNPNEGAFGAQAGDLPNNLSGGGINDGRY